MLHQIRVDPVTMVAVRGSYPSAPRFPGEASLPHDAQDLFVICEDTLPVEFPGYPTIAVTGKLFNDGLDAAGKLRLVKGFFLRLVVVRAA
jgi:hypothetical protein